MKPRQVMIVTVANNSMTEAEKAQFKREIAALGETVVFLPYNPHAGSCPDIVTHLLPEPEEPTP
jgi:hypothetical protein